MTIENPHPQNRRVNLKGYPLYSANDVANWPRIDWLVEGIIQRSSSAVIFGESRIGKSFLALDLATKLAKGEDWFGYAVKPCKVI
jgi:RecA-family ATPase